MDQVEGLKGLYRARAHLSTDRKSRFHGLTDHAIGDRLEHDRQELDRWVVMMLVASFEATVRTDAKSRIDSSTRDEVRRPLRDLHKEYGDRVRLKDILAIWETRVTVSSATKDFVGRLLKHRHWLAHGRYWTNRGGQMPEPMDAHAQLGAYMQALHAGCADFPRL